MSHVVNLIGEGLRLWKCQITIDEYNRLNEFRVKKQLSWYSIFFNLDILEYLGYESWTDFSYHESLGLIVNTRNIVEIKLGAKKLLKISSNRVLNQGLLFDLYHTNISRITLKEDSNNTSFYLASTEIGTIGKYKIFTDNLNINKLQFNLKEFKELNCFMIDEIVYDSEIIKRNIEDTVTRNFQVII